METFKTVRLENLMNDFNLIYSQIEHYTLVSWDRCESLFKLAKSVKNLKGNVSEVGVYKGGTAKLIAKALPRKVAHLFDTFIGLPKRDESIDLHHEGDFADTSFIEVLEYLKDCGNVIIHPGFFPDTAKGIKGKFCFVYVDVDLYPSVKSCLEYFYDRMVVNGIMVFDDYEWHATPGVKKAIKEFLKGKPEKLKISAKYQCMFEKV